MNVKALPAFCRLTIIILGVLCTGAAYAQQPARSYQQLRAGFLEPPAQAHPKTYWWWLNGNTDTVRLMQELAAMKAAGIAGVDIFDIGARAPNNPNKMIPGGPPFMGPQALSTLVKVIKKATEYKMEVGLSLSSSWNAGGSWVTPEHAGKSLYHSSVRVSGQGARKIQVPFPVISKLDEKGKPRVIVYDAQGRPVYSKEVALLAYPADTAAGYRDTSRIVNLSAQFNAAKDELSWNVPAGEWIVQRFVCSNSGEQLKYYSDSSAGFIIDHFDSAATRFHFMYFIDHLKPHLGDFTKTALKSLYLASFEATGSVWTPSLPDEFRKINGYDVYKLLPSLFNEKLFDTVLTAGFRHDFNKTISECMIRNHYGKGREIANSYGLQLISEAGGPGPPLHNVPVEGLKALGALDIPRGEFWNKHAVYDPDSIDLLMLVKEVSAAAHMYGRKIVEEESFTSFQHWTDGPFELKPLGDRAFCEGMNRVVMHGFSHNPSSYGYPGIVYHAGTHFSDKNVWWPKAKPFFDYLARISFLMQETEFVSDVLYYYGDQVPNFVTPKNTRFSVGPGYDYDIINTDVLLRELTVKDGKLALPGGGRYHVLALGNMGQANPAVLKKLQLLASQGAQMTGEKPKTAIGLGGQPGSTTEVAQIARILWQETPAPGKILAGRTPLAVLQSLGVKPDFSYRDNQSDVLDYIHQKTGSLDLYFVRNTTDRWISRNCSFRQRGRVPEIWDPVSRAVMPAMVYRQDSFQVHMPVSLAPYQSVWVVFKPGTAAAAFPGLTGAGEDPPRFEYVSTGLQVLDDGVFALQGGSAKRPFTVSNKRQVLEGPWQVSFNAKWGAPATANFPSLVSWTKSETPGIKYYSGTAMYTKAFNYAPTPGQRVYLDLGEIEKVGEAWLNGRPLGIAWAKPYRFDITGLVKTGANELKVGVINAWANRIIGDALTGEKFTSTNLPVSTTGVPWSKSPLVPSGLLGPVVIEQTTVISR